MEHCLESLTIDASVLFALLRVGGSPGVLVSCRAGSVSGRRRTVRSTRRAGRVGGPSLATAALGKEASTNAVDATDAPENHKRAVRLRFKAHLFARWYREAAGNETVTSGGGLAFCVAGPGLADYFSACRRADEAKPTVQLSDPSQVPRSPDEIRKEFATAFTS